MKTRWTMIVAAAFCAAPVASVHGDPEQVSLRSHTVDLSGQLEEDFKIEYDWESENFIDGEDDGQPGLFHITVNSTYEVFLFPDGTEATTACYSLVLDYTQYDIGFFVDGQHAITIEGIKEFPKDKNILVDRAIAFDVDNNVVGFTTTNGVDVEFSASVNEILDAGELVTIYFCQSPANDRAEHALPVEVPGSVDQPLGGANDGTDVADCPVQKPGDDKPDVWFTYVSTFNETVIATTCEDLEAFANFNSRLVAYQWDPADGVPPDEARVGCNLDDPDNPCGDDGQSTTIFSVEALQPYMIRLSTEDSLELDPDNPPMAKLRFLLSDRTECPTDLDGNGETDPFDLATLLDQWGTSGDSADFNGDGVVDAFDLAQLLDSWGPCEVP